MKIEDFIVTLGQGLNGEEQKVGKFDFGKRNDREIEKP